MDIEEVLNAIRGKSALVIGDMMLDESIYYESVRKANEFKGSILKEVGRERYPGGAANVAVNCNALGARVTLLGAFGTDRPGQHLYQQLTDHGIDVPTVSWENRTHMWSTTTKRRVYIDGQGAYRIDEDRRGVIPLDLTLAAVNSIKPDVILLSDYQKGVFTYDLFVRDLVLSILGNGRPSLLTVNPKPPLVSILPGAHLISVNNDEFHAARGSLLQEVTDTPTPRMSDILIRTMGEAGLEIYNGDGEFRVRRGTGCIDLPDVVGCGDTAFAAASLSLLFTSDPLMLGKISVAAGTAKAMKKGTVPVTPLEIMNVWREFESAR